MDENVIAAMARWPDVPAVYGWLSLTIHGQWRLHPDGDALGPTDNPGGESITSPQILKFIDRNYTSDARGQWFFQNGPQKVYVRLDGAPYILHTESEGDGGQTALRTHNGLAVATVSEWWLDDNGRLYARTPHGPALIAGRDLAAVLAGLRTRSGDALLNVLEGQLGSDKPVELDTGTLSFCRAAELSACLGFISRPTPD
jgi:hypothetical protein